MMNPMQIMQMIKNGGNPQQMLMNMMRQNANNPIISNALDMVQKNDIEGLERLTRNLCKEKGIDADKAIQDIKRNMKL